MTSYIIGLTGGIGSGKSTITEMFASLGVDIVDADVIARKVVEPGSSALQAISLHFGAQFIADNQTLNRSLLRSRVFNNPADKQWLNELLHPLIRQEIVQQVANATSAYCLLVAPLLIENNLNKLVNRVLVVDIDEATQLSRTLLRDPSSAAEIKRIIASQVSRNERLEHADDVVNNQSSDLDEIRQRVLELDQKYRTAAKSSTKTR